MDTSVHAVRGYVHEYLAQRVTEARTKLAQYGERFAAAMTAALEANQQGEASACVPLCLLLPLGALLGMGKRTTHQQG